MDCINNRGTCVFCFRIPNEYGILDKMCVFIYILGGHDMIDESPPIFSILGAVEVAASAPAARLLPAAGLLCKNGTT